jgi:hypothetical protein
MRTRTPATSLRPVRQRHHGRVDHQQRFTLELLQLGHLRRHLRAGFGYYRPLAYQQLGHQHHQRHLHGRPARGRHRCAVPGGQSVSLADPGGKRHLQQWHDRSPERHRQRLTQPARLLTLFDGDGDDDGGDDGGDGGSNELQNGVALTNLSGATGSETHYFIEIPADAENLEISTSGGSGDVDLYVRFGAEPTQSNYDCRPYRWGNEETCTFDDPAAGTWYVMLHAYEAYSGVTLEASFDAPEPEPEPEPDGGELHNGVAVTDLSGATGSETHFFIEVPAGAENLEISTSGGSGDVDLYVRYGAEPTQSNYDCRPYRWGNDETCTFDDPAGGTWYVMLHAYEAYAGVTLEASFDEPSGTPCSNCEHYTGTLTGTGNSQVQPDGTYYQAGAGTHNAWLEGPSTADFDLELYRWNGSSWTRVASATTPDSSEHISYQGTSGFYYWRVLSYSGSGSYDLWLDTP